MLGSRHPKFPGKLLNYIDARKLLYVPAYVNKVKDTKSLKELRDHISNGRNVVICGFDGPRNEDGTPTCEKVTKELLVNKIHYTKHPFGHEYVLAAEVVGIDMGVYCK